MLWCYYAIILCMRFIFVQKFQWRSSEFFFNLRSSSGKSQSQEKLTKISHILKYSFPQKTSLILWTSTYLTLKIIYSRNASKNLSEFTNVLAKMFLFGVSTKYFHCIICWRPRTAFWKCLESKRLYISIYLLKKLFVSQT